MYKQKQKQSPTSSSPETLEVTTTTICGVTRDNNLQFFIVMLHSLEILLYIQYSAELNANCNFWQYLLCMVGIRTL